MRAARATDAVWRALATGVVGLALSLGGGSSCGRTSASAPPTEPTETADGVLASVSPSLAAKLAEALRAKGPSYAPRTRHKNADGSPKYTNRLILETSPYLLQQAHNPVNWYAWGDEAFDTARRLGRRPRARAARARRAARDRQDRPQGPGDRVRVRARRVRAADDRSRGVRGATSEEAVTRSSSRALQRARDSASARSRMRSARACFVASGSQVAPSRPISATRFVPRPSASSARLATTRSTPLSRSFRSP